MPSTRPLLPLLVLLLRGKGNPATKSEISSWILLDRRAHFPQNLQCRGDTRLSAILVPTECPFAPSDMEKVQTSHRVDVADIMEWLGLNVLDGESANVTSISWT